MYSNDAFCEIEGYEIYELPALLNECVTRSVETENSTASALP